MILLEIAFRKDGGRYKDFFGTTSDIRITQINIIASEAKKFLTHE